MNEILRFHFQEVILKMPKISIKSSNEERHERVKWELGFAYFWLGKWNFAHWDWDSSAIYEH